MSSPIMQSKTEDVDSVEKRRKHTVSIIGCGQAGLIQAILFADAGFRVICADTDQTAVSETAKGKTHILRLELEAKLKSHVKNGHITATNDFKEAISKSDIIAVTTPLKIDTKRRANYSNVESMCKRIGSSLSSGSLVIVTNLVGIGNIEGLIKETLENTSGLKAESDFGLAYSPLQTSDSLALYPAANHPRIIAATGKNSLRVASKILESITNNNVRIAENLKAAEAAALFEVMRKDVNIALEAESAFLCERLGLDYLEVHKLLNANTIDLSRTTMLPDDSAADEPYLLLEDAENLNVKLRIPSVARDVNNEIIRHVANLVKDALKNCGKTMRRARISVLGISQTVNTKGPAKKTAKDVAEILEARGAKVSLYDPNFARNETADMPYHFKKNLAESTEGADCIVILTAHDQFKRLNLRKMKLTMKMPAAIVDLEGVVEPNKIEKEGFVYRGLGRGVWTK